MYSSDLIEFCNKVKPIKLSVTKNKEELYFKGLLFKETEFLNNINPPLVLRYYCILNNINEIPKCKVCNKEAAYKKAYPDQGFSDYCSPKCSRSDKTVSKEVLKLLENKDWLYNERINLKKSKKLIGKELGISEPVVDKWIKIHNIPAVKYNESGIEAQIYLNDKKWLYEKHKIEKLTCEEIAVIIGSSKATVNIFLNKHKIDTNEPNSYPRRSNKITKPTKEIADFITSFYNDEIIFNKRGLIGSLELDIYIPNKNFAIEYNGIFSHVYRPWEEDFSKRKDERYHVTKTNLCEEQNIYLFHIFSYWWNEKQDICKSMIRNKLNFTENKIYARDCYIKEVSVYDKNIFLENNHLQGKDKSQIKLGLYYKEELVSLITFISPPRYNKNYDWELVRFCNKLNTNIVGGFSKLLKYFRNNYEGNIISYANRTYSNGKLYENNGFELLHINDPRYYWVLKNIDKLYFRSNFTKKKCLKMLNKPEWTEEQIMYELGNYKIFDCGTKTYLLK